MGDIPAKTNMVSSMITFPQTGSQIPSDTSFTITVQMANIVAGSFTDADATYYAGPQFLQNGVIVGHTHVTVQDLGKSLNPTVAPDATQFAFFKGINDAGNGQGLLSANVTGGLPAGNYRVCTMASASNHQPVLMPVAQRGTPDDCTKFVVTGSGTTINAAANDGSKGEAAAALVSDAVVGATNSAFAASVIASESSAAIAATATAAAADAAGASTSAAATTAASRGGNRGGAKANSVATSSSAVAATDAAGASTSAAATTAASRGGNRGGAKANSVATSSSAVAATATAATATTSAAGKGRNGGNNGAKAINEGNAISSSSTTCIPVTATPAAKRAIQHKQRFARRQFVA
jgi:hypothetical protein